MANRGDLFRRRRRQRPALPHVAPISVRGGAALVRRVRCKCSTDELQPRLLPLFVLTKKMFSCSPGDGHPRNASVEFYFRKGNREQQGPDLEDPVQMILAL